MLLLRNNQTYYVNYNEMKDIVQLMDIKFLNSDYHQIHLFKKKLIFEYLLKYNILGVNGGLSKELFVHPSVDPSTKFDGSFIS